MEPTTTTTEATTTPTVEALVYDLAERSTRRANAINVLHTAADALRSVATQHLMEGFEDVELQAVYTMLAQLGAAERRVKDAQYHDVKAALAQVAQ